MSHQSHSLLPRWVAWLIGLTFVISSILVSGLIYLTASAYMARPFNPLEEVTSTEGPEEGFNLPPLVSDGSDAQPEISATQTAVSAQSTVVAQAPPSERITILLMGIDRRPGQPFVSRTDTMMLLSVDPSKDSASILSIPRDLYAEIPGFGRDRINSAFVFGARNGGPAGGAQLAMETVSLNLGVHIDHYVLVDFGAFVRIVDSLGGIEIYVPVTINDPSFPDMNHGFDPLFIPAGQHTFDGATALKYARTRHQDNDFNRAERQQQVVMSVRSKVLNLGADDLLRQLPILYGQLQDGVRTDLSLGQMVTLASIASGIPSENIDTAVLDYTYVTSHTTQQGASVLILENEVAGPLIQELFP